MSITTFFYHISVFIFTNICQCKHMTQIGVEAFQQYICLPMPNRQCPVHRAAVTIRTFFTQIVCQLNLNTFTSYGRYMKIFVISLWSTETGRICEARLKVIHRLIKQIDTGTENQFINQVVLIHTQTNEHRELSHTPFILNKSTGYAYILFHITVIPGHDIMQSIILIFKTTGKSGRSKKAIIHLPHIHATQYPGKIICFTIRIEILLSAIIAVTIRMLDRTV